MHNAKKHFATAHLPAVVVPRLHYQRSPRDMTRRRLRSAVPAEFSLRSSPRTWFQLSLVVVDHRPAPPQRSTSQNFAITKQSFSDTRFLATACVVSLHNRPGTRRSRLLRLIANRVNDDRDNFAIDSRRRARAGRLRREAFVELHPYDSAATLLSAVVLPHLTNLR